MGPLSGISVSTIYTTKLVTVLAGVYARWTHVQLAFQRKQGHLPKILQNKHVTEEGGNKWNKEGTTSAKSGYGGWNLGGGGGHGAKVAT